MLKDLGRTEVGAFAVTSLEDPLFIADIKLVPQSCTGASVKFDDEGIADYLANMAAEGLHPAEFFRIWIHTHPTFGPGPSSTDEETFREIFGQMDWAVMLIIGQGNECYAKLRAKIMSTAEKAVGSGAVTWKLNTYVEWNSPCKAVDTEALIDEYMRCVREGWRNSGYVQTAVGYASVQPESYYTRKYDHRGSYFEKKDEMTGFMAEDATTPAATTPETAPAEKVHKRLSEMTDAEFEAYAEEHWPSGLAIKDNREESTYLKGYQNGLDESIEADAVTGLSSKDRALYLQGLHDGLQDSDSSHSHDFLQDAADAVKDEQIRINANADNEAWAGID